MFSLLARGLFLLGAFAAQGNRPGEGVREAGADPSATELSGQDDAVPPAQKPQLESLFEGALVGAVDAQDFTETPGYRQLLESLARYGEEELRQKAGRRLDVAQALADPGDWRGEIVRVRALVADLRYMRLSRPLGEHVDVIRAFLAEADGSEGVVVDFLPPPPSDLEIKDVVDVEAVFYRTVRYEDRKGAIFDGPYLIARGLRRPDPDTLTRRTAFDGMAKILIGAAVAFFVIRVLLTMRKKPAAPAASVTARALRERARVPLRPDPPAHKP